MGKLSDLLKEYKTLPMGSDREKEVKDDILRIVEWMKENGYMNKPFTFPKKQSFKQYGPTLNFPPDDSEEGIYCSHCSKKLPMDIHSSQHCPHCDWGVGAVMLVSKPKVLNNTGSNENGG